VTHKSGLAFLRHLPSPPYPVTSYTRVVVRKPPDNFAPMNKREFRGSTIGIIVTIGLSIFPLTQITLLTLNGGLTYTFAIPFGATTKSGVTEVASVVINLILTIVGLITFYLGERTLVKIVSAFLIMFSGQMLVTFMADEFNGGDNYLLGWLTVSGIPSLTILTVGLIKHYTKDRQLKKVS
jgi:hypothetical protein